MKNKSNAKATEIMKSPITTLGTETSLRDAAGTLTDRGISGAPVIDHKGKAVGVVSLFDIVTYLAGLERPAGEPGGFYRYSYPMFHAVDGWDDAWESDDDGPMGEMTVGEIMTPSIISVEPETPAAEIASLMWERHIHRVFVAKDDVPTGVISTMDVLGALSGKAKAAAKRG